MPWPTENVDGAHQILPVLQCVRFAVVPVARTESWHVPCRDNPPNHCSHSGGRPVEIAIGDWVCRRQDECHLQRAPCPSRCGRTTSSCRNLHDSFWLASLSVLLGETHEISMMVV